MGEKHHAFFFAARTGGEISISTFITSPPQMGEISMVRFANKFQLKLYVNLAGKTQRKTLSQYNLGIVNPLEGSDEGGFNKVGIHTMDWSWFLC